MPKSIDVGPYLLALFESGTVLSFLNCCVYFIATMLAHLFHLQPFSSEQLICCLLLCSLSYILKLNLAVGSVCVCMSISFVSTPACDRRMITRLYNFQI